MLLHHSPGLSVSGSRRVFLAIPTYGPLPALTSFSLFQSHAALIAAGYDTELAILVGHCHVDDARNLLVRDFLASKCDEMLFIDADMGWRAQDLVRFLSHDRDVVAASYPMKKDEEEYPCRFLGGEIWSDADGLIEVDGVPTGFLKIRRHVLETLAQHSRVYRASVDDPDSRACAEIFLRDVVNGARMSGDYNFCRRWRALGGRIFVDPEIYLEHVGEKHWQGSLGSYLRRRNGLALRRSIEAIRAKRDPDFLELVMDWGNDGFAAGPELLCAALQVARQAKGPVIEAGSGLTSLVMAATGAEVHALEHDDGWLCRVTDAAGELGLDTLHVHRAPLADTPHGRWYGFAELPWRAADIVLCDGPPRGASNRDVLFTRMDQMDCRPRCILRDDVARLEAPFSTWLDAHGYRVEIKGELRRFAVARLA